MTRPTWVFLRGLIRQHRHWEDFPARFQAAFPDAVILTPDLPGNGDLHDRESPTDIAGMVDSVRKQIASRGVHGPVHVLALSLGAMTAIEWMRQEPAEIERAVLINTSIGGLNGITERLRPENYPGILKSLVFNNREERERFILDITTNLFTDKAALAQKWAGYAKEQPTSRMNGLRQLIAAGTYTAPAARPHEHVLVLQSLGDHLVDPVCSTRVAETWRWPMASHPTAGHDLALDDSAWIIAQVKDWLGH